MAKHPVPKKKTSKARSKRRYASFKTKVLKRLTNEIAGAKHKFKNATKISAVEESTTPSGVTTIKA